MPRLAIFSHKLFRRTPNGLRTTGALTMQVEALSPFFDQITLCVPVVEDPNFCGLGVDSTKVIFNPLPYYHGRTGFLVALPGLRRKIVNVTEQSDLALAILPSYVGILASLLCQRKNFPLFLWVVGNWGQNVVIRRSSSWGKWLASVSLAPILNWSIKRVTRDILTFYNGKILFDQGKAYHYTRTSSSIRQRDLFSPEVTSPMHSPPLLLFVGRLSPEKGLPILLQAVAQLKAQGEMVHLQIAGSGEMQDTLRDYTQKLSLKDQVDFLGYISQRSELLRLYRESDMLILPSLQDLQPKVLLEAMSQSLPIITTCVGGIPSIIQDGVNGILIPPAKSNAIVSAVNKLKSDQELRRNLIKSGLKFARDHTVERETSRMIKIIASHFQPLQILQ